MLDITLFKIKKLEENDRLIGHYIYVEDDFPDWVKQMSVKIEEEENDWEKYYEINGITDKFEYVGYSVIDGVCRYEFKDNKANKTVQINMDDVPLKKVEYSAVGCVKFSYQSKGMIPTFYSDYNLGKIGYYCWTKQDLIRIKNDYCLKEEDEYFQKYFIDRFVDGESVVTFDW